jgi:carbonic anhydrase
MKSVTKILALIGITAFLFSCEMTQEKESNTTQQAQIVGVVEDVLTKEEQDALTPDMVIQSLKRGQ